jgi:hypothetical protein
MRKKAARELRQSQSSYRCCLPALAGFACRQSIVPDGASTIKPQCVADNDFVIKPLAIEGGIHKT